MGLAASILNDMFFETAKRKRYEKQQKFYNVTDETLTEEQLHEFQEAFVIYDHDRNGRITMNELSSVLRSLGQNPTEKEIKDMMVEVDIDGSGAIEFSEFVLMMSKKVKDSDEELIEAFRVFDPYSTGQINVKEIKKTLFFCGSRLTMEEINDIVKIADIDGDGTLSYDEFKKIMRSPQPPPFQRRKSVDLTLSKKSLAHI